MSNGQFIMHHVNIRISTGQIIALNLNLNALCIPKSSGGGTMIKTITLRPFYCHFSFMGY